MAFNKRAMSVLAAAAAGLALAAPGSQAAKDPEPFGHPCTAQDGVRFCETSDLTERVPSFDKVPLDVDVTLPSKGKGPFPTIVMLHGYGGSKDDFEDSDQKGDGSTTFHYNNNFYAKQGYAVVNYSARGFGNSCGAEDSRDDPDCDDGYIHLADQRYEGRDTQYLLGLLVDQGIVNPHRIGVTGISYGGGQSTELALLRDRIRTPDGDFKPWRSPDGKHLSIAAAYPRWPWTDLVASLLPNGRFLDFASPNRHDSREPPGIEIATYVAGLYASGKASGYYCGDSPPGPEPCTDEGADINRWFARIEAGEPYDTADARAIANEIFEHHQAFGLPEKDPAPLLFQSGWTDDLFPARESLRMYNELRGNFRKNDRGDTYVALQFGDLGHSRGANKPSTNRPLNDQGAEFFAKLLQGRGSAPRSGSVTAFSQTCPDSEPADGPFRARSWEAIHPRTVSFSSSVSQSVLYNPPLVPVDPNGLKYDPIAGGVIPSIPRDGNPCRQSPDSSASESAPDTAVYRGKASKGFTMIGLPTVTAQIATTENPLDDGVQLDSRLWDVAPSGSQILVSRGAYRVENGTDGKVTFQLSGNAWCFAPGHTPKLELLGIDKPYLRPTTGPDSTYSIAVSSVKVKLPAAEGKCRRGGGSD